MDRKELPATKVIRVLLGHPEKSGSQVSQAFQEQKVKGTDQFSCTLFRQVWILFVTFLLYLQMCAGFPGLIGLYGLDGLRGQKGLSGIAGIFAECYSIIVNSQCSGNCQNRCSRIPIWGKLLWELNITSGCNLARFGYYWTIWQPRNQGREGWWWQHQQPGGCAGCCGFERLPRRCWYVSVPLPQLAAERCGFMWATGLMTVPMLDLFRWPRSAWTIGKPRACRTWRETRPTRTPWG